MLPNPETISGKAVTEAYLAQLNEEQAAGHLLLLPPDRFHRELNENWINRRYLDQRTAEIFRVKGQINVHEQYVLERQTLRVKARTKEGDVSLHSRYGFRRFKPPLVGRFSIDLDYTSPAPDRPPHHLTIDLSDCHYRVSNEINHQLINAAIINSVVRSFAFRRDKFSSARVSVQEILVHSIDTGFDVVDYAIRRCLDQAFDEGGDAPTVKLEDGLRLLKTKMKGSGEIKVDIITGEHENRT